MYNAAKSVRESIPTTSLPLIIKHAMKEGKADALFSPYALECLGSLSATDLARFEPQLKEITKRSGITWLSFKQTIKEAQKQAATGNPGDLKAAKDELVEQIKAALQEQFEVVGFIRKDDTIALQLWMKRHRKLMPLRLISPRVIPPLLALESGRLLNWFAQSRIEIPEELRSQRTVNGSRPKTDTELEEELSAEVLRAFLDMAPKARPFEDLKLLRDGLHYRDGELIWVDKKSWWLRSSTGEWYDWERSVHNNYLLEGTENWTTCLPIDESPYTPREVYQAMVELFETGWILSDKFVDSRILALSLMKAAVCDLFQRMEQIHILGGKGSGKSRLPKLVLGELGIIPKLVECAWLKTNISNAALVRTFQGRRGLLILDEFERGSHRNAILDTLRSSMDIEAGPERADGEDTVERVVRLPIWMVSIDSLDRDADQDRVIEIRMPKVEGAQAPEINISESGWLEKWDTDKLRRSITLCLLPYVDQLRQAYLELQRRKLPGEELTDYRFKESLLGLLAVAKITGENADQLAERIFKAKAPARQMAKETSQEDLLLAAILDTPIEMDDPLTGRRTYVTVRTLIMDGDMKRAERIDQKVSEKKKGRKRQDDDFLVYMPHPGFAYDQATQTLYLNWNGIRPAILSRTDFKNMHERELLNTLSRLKGRGVFLESAVKTIGVHRKNYAMLNLKDIL